MIGSVISGALTGKRKRRRGATKYLTGGRGSFLNGSTLLAMAGVAWGLYETMTAKKGPVYAQGGAGAPAPPVGPQGSPAVGQAPAGPPATSPPPLPTAAGPAGGTQALPDVPDEVVRLVRLTISAAKADGALSPQEEAGILEHARSAGAESIVQRELRSSFTLAQIVAGVTAPEQREELYTLAFAITRGDEQVTGGERIYLAQLAHQLGLDAAAAQRLELEAATRIESAARETDEGAPPQA